jgi:hypothetical protein
VNRVSPRALATPRDEVVDFCDSNVLMQNSSGPDFEMLCALYNGDPTVFKRLKQRFHELDEATIIRHLLACKGVYEKTVAHIEAHLQWRSRTFVTSDIPNHQSCGPGCLMYTHGFDKAGHPLVIFTSRLLDPKSRDLAELMRWLTYIFELAIERLPPHLVQITIVSNRIGSSSADLEMLKATMVLIENNYPFRIAKVLIYPVSVAVKSIGGIIKSIAGFHASNFHLLESIDVLKEHIADEYIPTEMGGSCDYKFNISDCPPSALFETNIHCSSFGSNVSPLEMINDNSSSVSPPEAPISPENPKGGAKRVHSIVGTYSYMVSPCDCICDQYTNLIPHLS